ncbi:hypothetical protein V6R21_03615 [Limibacter armeniacum]|uniref:hypothetical protein n=1 Tax=Limibacter armeniacum TaxID=466084 RepID=UPI002FE61C89
MKKVLFFLLVLTAGFISANDTFAQDTYKKFKVGVGMFYAGSMDKELASGGIGFYVEPKYNFTDKITAGLYLGTALMGGGEIDSEGLVTELDAAAVSPYLVTGEYYFTTNKVRPYAGLGLGIYKRAAVSVSFDDGSGNNGSIEGESTSNFGVAPKVGLLLGHFDLALTYNVTGDGIADYLAFNVGFNIGGGKK